MPIVDIHVAIWRMSAGPRIQTMTSITPGLPNSFFSAKMYAF